MIDPIHTANLNGHPVRFFRSPLEGPDFPWHPASDLHAAGGSTDEGQAAYVHGLYKSWSKEVRHIVVGGELTTIAPHYIGQVMAVIINGDILGFDRAYTDAAIAATKAATPDMTVHERVRYMVTAAMDGAARPPGPAPVVGATER